MILDFVGAVLLYLIFRLTGRENLPRISSFFVTVLLASDVFSLGTLIQPIFEPLVAGQKSHLATQLFESTPWQFGVTVGLNSFFGLIPAIAFTAIYFFRPRHEIFWYIFVIPFALFASDLIALGSTPVSDQYLVLNLVFDAVGAQFGTIIANTLVTKILSISPGGKLLTSVTRRNLAITAVAFVFYLFAYYGLYFLALYPVGFQGGVKAEIVPFKAIRVRMLPAEVLNLPLDKRPQTGLEPLISLQNVAHYGIADVGALSEFLSASSTSRPDTDYPSLTLPDDVQTTSVSVFGDCSLSEIESSAPLPLREFQLGGLSSIQFLASSFVIALDNPALSSGQEVQVSSPVQEETATFASSWQVVEPLPIPITAISVPAFSNIVLNWNQATPKPSSNIVIFFDLGDTTTARPPNRRLIQLLSRGAGSAYLRASRSSVSPPNSSGRATACTPLLLTRAEDKGRGLLLDVGVAKVRWLGILVRVQHIGKSEGNSLLVFRSRKSTANDRIANVWWDSVGLTAARDYFDNNPFKWILGQGRRFEVNWSENGHILNSPSGGQLEAYGDFNVVLPDGYGSGFDHLQIQGTFTSLLLRGQLVNQSLFEAYATYFAAIAAALFSLLAWFREAVFRLVEETWFGRPRWIKVK